VNFVLTVVHRKILAVLRRAARRHEVSLAGGQDSVPRPEGEWTAAARAAGAAEWRRDLAAEALGRVRRCPRTSARTFAVFEAYALQRQPVGGVARAFGLKENAVYQIRNRMLRRVQAEVRALAAERAGVRTCL
jgi:DNA-directed RNA polymerase specialized sigma24 family protein